jgi:hypothetical protein
MEADVVEICESRTQTPWKFVWHVNSLGKEADMLLAELNAD